MNASSQTLSGVRPLHQSPQAVPPVEALYKPRPSDAYPLPLSTALSLARQDLAAQQGANIYDREQMVRAAVTLEIRLRQVLAALDAEAAGGAL